MTTILFCPVTFNLAETTRMIQVARALGDGLEPVFMGYESDFVELIVAAGFEYRAQQPAFTAAQRTQLLAFDQGRSLRSPLDRTLVGARVVVERELIRALGAKAVVTGSNVTSFISARAEGVPLFYPVPFALTRPHVAQVRNLGLVAGDGRMARGLDRLVTSAFRWAYNSAPLAPRAFGSVARDHGVRPLRTIGSLILADHNLLTEMPWDLDGFTLPAGFQRIGPIFAHLDAPIPAIVDALTARPEPLVYLGLGSSADRALALGACEALAALPVNVVAPIRQYLAADDPVPVNVHVTDLLPVHMLGDRLAAAVIHGGQGTVQTACATGVPFVGMGLQPEQTWNVRRCQERGNAIAVAPRDVRRPVFLDAVRRVLSDPGIRRAADEVRIAYADEDGASAAARVIAQTLAA